jgi:NADH:ubiquinone oxidoreductase subunit 3 (subunit A)
METGQIGIISVVAILNGLFLLGLSIAIQRICGIYSPGAVKNDTYECGMKSEMDSQVQFDIKYYLFAIMFIIFDVEFVFLMPWASLFTFMEAGTRGFIIFEAFMFVAILLIGLLYAWKKGALDWNQESV